MFSLADTLKLDDDGLTFRSIYDGAKVRWTPEDLSLIHISILYKDEDISKQFGFQVNIGVIDAPLSVMDTLPGSIEMRIELAK